jgi:type IV pilus assembly protein PilQ
MALELLESESKVRIVTAPKVITQNKKPATITSTDTTSFAIQTVSVGAPPITTFQSIPVVLNLAVTPQVTNEGSINMEVNLSKGSFGGRPSAQAPPDTTQRSITTNVLVDNGSTVVLGGLYTTTNAESHSGIPFLKNLPLVGWLFRTPENPSTSRNELLIFLTPRIINQEEAGLIDKGKSATL